MATPGSSIILEYDGADRLNVQMTLEATFTNILGLCKLIGCFVYVNFQIDIETKTKPISQLLPIKYQSKLTSMEAIQEIQVGLRFRRGLLSTEPSTASQYASPQLT